MTDAEFIAWLKAPAPRCVLVEAAVLSEGVETTRYLSNIGYVTGAADTPANQIYQPHIRGGMTITERLVLDGGKADISFGNVEIDNTNGERDSWLEDIWENRAISVYVGDMRWARSDFRLVFAGLIEDIAPLKRNRHALVLRDKSEQLNTAVTETLLGGGSANAEKLLPTCFGEVHNVEPLLISPGLLQYQVHNTTIERVIEVRDNGVVVGRTDILSNGTFVLTASPAGQITASVQGAKPGGTYTNTIAGLVQHLATLYGKTPLDYPTDLDTANLAAFDAANPQAVGLYLPDRANVLESCQLLASSIGAQVNFSATGKLRLLQVALPAVGTPTSVGAQNIKTETLEPVRRIPVKAGAKINYCRNYTVQTNLQTGIPAEHKDLYKQEWLTASDSDSSVATNHKLTAAPIEEETQLLVTSDAQAEATRRLSLWKTPRTVYRYRGFPELMLEELGGAQTLTYPRWGMGSGVTAQIVSITRDWLKPEVTIEVLV